MDPINYGVVNPAEAIMSGLKIGVGLDAVAAQRREQALAEQQRQAALVQQQQMQADLRTLYSNPDAGHAEYAAVMTKYPTLAENIGKAYKTLDEGRQKTTLEFGSRVYGALQADPKVAVEMLRQRAKADPKEAQHLNTMADLAESGPEGLRSARLMMATGLAGMLGPDKFAEGFGKIGAEGRAQEQAGADLKKKEADAKAAESDAVIKAEQAKVAPQTVLLDLEKKGWDIKKVQEDIAIAKENARIAAINAATSRANSDTQRKELELKLNDAIQKRDEKIREKVATAEAGAANIDNMLNTVQRILKNPSLDSVLGSLEGKAYYPNATLGMLNPGGDGDERADAIALIETLGSQAFLAQIPNIKGMGALSNAEGEKLQSALQNLSRAQSEKQFRENLNEASRLLLKGRENLAKSTGVPLPKADTPAAPGTRPPLSAFEGK
jgi:hypothetical protein